MTRNRANTRPGPGWKHVAGPVYEHCSGTRIHLLGLIKTPDGRTAFLDKWPDAKEGRRFMKICGGNRKRALMAWAMSIARKNHQPGQINQ